MPGIFLKRVAVSKFLPLRPNLEQLKNQAKSLRKAHRQADPGVVPLLIAHHPRFSGLSAAAILAASFSLQDAQLVIAREHGFPSWPKLVEALKMLNPLTDSRRLLADQYKEASNLKARVQLHDRFSTNKYGWHPWVFDQIRCPPQSRILEIGCGNGMLWSKNSARIPASWEIILSDYSPGMLKEAQNNLDHIKQIKDYRVIDAQKIDCADASFDVVIANHVLYHVPNRNKALAEIRRVLKNGGMFYTATNGAVNGPDIRDWVKKVRPELNTVAKDWFSLETGATEVSAHFPRFTVKYYKDALKITETSPLTAYVQSTISMRLGAKALAEFVKIVEE
jgi:ubiquinone/menaquinone biosynthesis C-methylase UbiE